MAAQNAKAFEIVKEMLLRVLGREEKFSLSVRRCLAPLRYARDSKLLMFPQ